MKKIMITVIILLNIIMLTSAENNLNVQKCGYNLRVSDEKYNDSLKYPMLLCNDTAYLSVRDAAKLGGYEVEWDEGSETISLYEGKGLQLSMETAEKIVRLIVSDSYADRVTDNTKFSMFTVWDETYGRQFYSVRVTFDRDENKKEYDMVVDVFDNCKIKIYKMENGQKISVN